MLFRSKDHASTFARLPTGLFVFCAFALGMFIATLIHTQSPERQSAPPAFATEALPDPDIALFELKGIIYTPATLPPEARKVFHDAWRAALEQYQRGLMQSVNITLDSRAEEFSELMARVGAKKINDDDVERFYDNNSEQMKAPLSEIRSELKRALEANRRTEASTAVIRELVQAGELTFAGQLSGKP
ncbi:hypothetical protein [Allohahella marinimesophila]|uniref:Uncharacterized protein n=1 Tax=Allohahella marinimesophila TaxID=1054972 RepID=A0ABP7PUD0_9GAMM